MTQTTDQERAEFEAQFKHLDLTQEPDAWGVPRYKHAAIWLAWEAWQVAPRAPVPPPGYRLQPLTEYDAMCAFIAATAPQLSEGLMTTEAEAEATPVQMPEPFTTLVRKKSWSTNCYEAAPRNNHRDWGRMWADERVQVYTEQQVRDLLAAQAKQGCEHA